MVLNIAPERTFWRPASRFAYYRAIRSAVHADMSKCSRERLCACELSGVYLVKPHDVYIYQGEILPNIFLLAQFMEEFCVVAAMGGPEEFVSEFNSYAADGSGEFRGLIGLAGFKGKGREDSCL